MRRSVRRELVAVRHPHGVDVAVVRRHPKLLHPATSADATRTMVSGQQKTLSHRRQQLYSASDHVSGLQSTFRRFKYVRV